MAASVAFYLLLSVIPMILLGVAVVASLIQDPDRAINQTFTFLNQFLPIGKQTIRPIIEGVIREKGSLTIVGLAGIALTATGGFATLENAINALWNRPNRGFLMNKVYAFGMMLAVGLLFALSLGLTSMVALASRTSALAWLNVGAWKPVLGIVTPLLISTVMFAVIYRFYPNGRTGWRSSLVSGAITAVLWELFKQGYGIYASRDHSPYGIIIGLVMWIYYSSTLILLGSELTWILEGCPDREGKEAVHAQRGRASQPGEA
jgi:membrane protein